MKDRRNFQFDGKIRAAFSFLEADFGFTVTTSSETKVRYESQKVYLEFEHGGYDFSISLLFGRLRATGTQVEMYDFALFLRLVNPELASTFGDMVAGTPEAVQAVIERLAMALRSAGSGIIKGDDQIFDRMKSVTWWQFRPDALQ